jgi:hypothetical protein
MSISKELNLAKLAMMNAGKELADKNFDKAATLYGEAANHYLKAGGNEKNNHIARLNQGSALVSGDREVEALAILKPLETDGFAGGELTNNLYAAHYNLGLKQIAAAPVDLTEAIQSFTAAKTYKETVDVCYRLGDALLKHGEFAEAEIEFTNLLGKGLAPAAFPASLKLNTSCQLISSQAQQGKALDDDTLLDAKNTFDAIDPADQNASKADADFIVLRLAEKYFIGGEVAKAVAVLDSLEAAIPGTLETNLTALKELGLYKHTAGNSKEAVKFLLGLTKAYANSAEAPVSEIAEHAKSQADDIVINVSNPDADTVSSNILNTDFTDLGAIGALDAMINTYFDVA